MDILVCIKQVPGTTQVAIDPETGTLQRDGVESKLNPYDLYALEMAFQLAGGGNVHTLTMGPPQARDALLTTLYMGAHSATLVSDRHFAGADVLSTAYTLAQAAKKCGHWDLILCGKQTTDGDTAQVGAEMAEFLGLPHAAGVLAAQADKTGLTVRLNAERHIVTQHMPTPCLLCMDGGINSPRLPSYKRKRGMVEPPVAHLCLADFEDGDPRHYGQAGSPTRVERIFPPESDTRRESIAGAAPQAAARMAAILAEKKFI